ncbi:MAG: holo-[acyl-carrier-protein] synthase [Rickettsiales bacterium]|nr:holo-[acyl-carrier-protein] synthase [Rickettsiales bacterium]|tara:strand:+ start:2165 stop:2560 length:396 start_codon:yes stop_codon:yes gene_type:complete
MYFSQGIDIIEKKRIKRLISLYGKIFLNKILSDNEILNFNYIAREKRNEKLSGIFAAKEAVSKALGFGFRNGVTYKNIEIINNEFNKPEINLVGESKKLFCTLKKENNSVLSVSISHEKNYALSIASILIY